MQKRVWVLLQEPFCGGQTRTMVYQNGQYSPATLADLGALDAQISLVLPAHWGTGCLLDIERSQRKHVHKLLPFLLEERLAWPLEEQHIAGERIGKHQVSAWVMARRWIAPCYEWMRAQNIALSQVYSVLQGLPLAPSQMTLWLCEDEVWVALPSGERMAVDETVFLPMLPQYCTAEASVEVGALQAMPTDSPLLEGLRQQGVKVTERVYPCDTWFEVCLQRLQADSGLLNVLQGEFAPLSGSRRAWHPWRAVVGVGVFGVLVQMGFNVAQGIWFDRHSDRLQQQTQQVYGRIYPHDEVPTSDVRERMEQRMQAAQEAIPQSSRLLRLLERLSAFTTKLPQWGIEVQSLEYDETSGSMTLKLQASDYERLNGWVATLSKSGLSATMASAVKTGQRLTAVVVIQG